MLKKDLNNPLLEPGGWPEFYRSYLMAYTLLEPVFQQDKVHGLLIADTPILAKTQLVTMVFHDKHYPDEALLH